MILHINEQPFARIMSHSNALTYFSMRSVTVNRSSVALLNNLANSTRLVYLDLSGQNDLGNIDFLGKPACSNIEYLHLDNCKNLDINSVLDSVRHKFKLKMLSLNGLALHPEAAEALSQFDLPSLFNLGLSGADISLPNIEVFVQNYPRLLFLQVSNHLPDRQAIRRLGAEYDVSISFN